MITILIDMVGDCLELHIDHTDLETQKELATIYTRLIQYRSDEITKRQLLRILRTFENGYAGNVAKICVASLLAQR